MPVRSLTGIKANNSVWRWYRGNLKKRRKNGIHGNACVKSESAKVQEMQDDSTPMYHYVEISPDNEAHSILGEMGFFGEKEENLAAYRSASKMESKGYDNFVVLEDFEPKIVLGTQNSHMSEDIKPSKRVLVESVAGTSPSQTEMPDSTGYLRLELHEAFFLSYGLGCLIVNDCDSEDKEMSIDDMWDKFSRVDEQFRHVYAVYHHFRSKGWVVRSGCKFGADFLLYKDGPPFYHASYSVRIRHFAVNDGKPTRIKNEKYLDWKDLIGLNRVTESASKELLLVDVFESEQSRNQSDNNVTDYLKCISLQEVLMRRWVASCERQDKNGSAN